MKRNEIPSNYSEDRMKGSQRMRKYSLAVFKLTVLFIN